MNPRAGSDHLATTRKFKKGTAPSNVFRPPQVVEGWWTAALLFLVLIAGCGSGWADPNMLHDPELEAACSASCPGAASSYVHLELSGAQTWCFCDCAHAEGHVPAEFGWWMNEPNSGDPQLGAALTVSWWRAFEAQYCPTPGH